MAVWPGGFTTERWQRRVRVALGQEPGDLVLTGGHVVDVFSEQLFQADVAIADGVIAGVGRYPEGATRLDCTGLVVAPSLIDAHVHTESSLLWISEFARAVVPHGTGAIVTDPHEIANVAGLAGLEAMRAGAVGLPLVIRLTVPSCVPASPLESPGAVFGPAEIGEVLNWPESCALGELMNYPALLGGDPGLAAELAAAAGRPIDGHAPGLSGAALQAYVASGPKSDHESVALEEAREKLRAGLMVMIREGSSARNLAALLPLITDQSVDRICFCSDDRDAHLLHHDGHVDAILRQAVRLGLDPLRAIRMATWNPARHWQIEGLGAVAPGYHANLVLVEDLQAMKVTTTLFAGQIVSRDGQMEATIPALGTIPPPLQDTVHLAPLAAADIRLPIEAARLAIIVTPGQIATGLEPVEPAIEHGEAVAAPARDLLKLVCIERHKASGRVGVGYVRGFGLERGALASTIAHDAHNIIAVGADDHDLLEAIAAVAESQGGLAAVADGEVLGVLPLPIGGLLSNQSLAETAAGYERLEDIARSLGSRLPSPFGLLAFMALSVIPEARVTDRGLIVVGAP